MGVQGLWDLLAPVGRRVSVETLAGKKLAIDASIWMVQFMKAMRDEKGEMIRHAHVLGFFRRICKLLFLRVRPVFVFDGATPGLKRRTVAARRRRRENATAKLRKTAEKLLLSRLKAKKLEELAAELKNSKQVPDAKGKHVIVDQEGNLAGTSSGEKHGVGSGVTDQKSLDELLAASLAAEEEGNLFCSGPSSLVDHIEEEDDGDDSEEMLFPVMNDNIDPTVLASLPPSMQLDLLVQMRERLMAENRQKYQKIKKIPSKFSELQIQSYLKTVAFRREINEVQKCAAGRGVGGVQTSRIASEANREYIFSSSFTGDKQKLTEGIPERNEAPVLPKDPASDTISHNSTNQLKSVPQARGYGNSEEFGNDVETYCDEKGRTRVSRVRGLGIRMTRDLQRNLDLIKERENDVSNKNVTSLEGENHINDKQATMMTRLGDVPLAHKISTTEGGSALEISFSEDDLVRNDTVDYIFSNLVVGGSNSKLSLGSDIFPSDEVTNESDSDNIWEEGMPGDETGRRTTNTNLVGSVSQDENVTGEGSDVDWDEGGCCVSAGHSSHKIEDERSLSRGTLEEEANLQEAIKRSLNDSRQEILDMVIEKESVIKLGVADSLPKHKDNMKESQYSHSLINKVDELDGSAGDNTQQGMTSLGGQLTSSRTVAGDSLVTDEAHQSAEVYKDEDKDTDGLEKSSSVKVYSSDSNLLAQQEKCREDLSHTKNQLGLIRGVCGLAKPTSNDQAASIIHASDSILVGETNGPQFGSNNNKLPEGSFTGIPLEDRLDAVSEFLQNSTEQEKTAGLHMDMPRARINEAETWEAREALKLSLDEEVTDLRQECERVGNEQRRLEINAESVSSEMFAECQELLQIFGLPYIIAPMEAEAQCAQMELANLVDGIVTDDSDVFLFGAQTVHKNIFDDRKYVETYLMKDIESELGLTRDKLIRMALLLGSDYTEGVSGIGIVNAIEVVHAFPEDDGLQEFREWLESPDISILSKFESKRKSSKVIARTSEEQQQSSSEASTSDGISEAKKVFMNKHRNVSKNWHVPSSFPSDTVVSAYTAPQVDHSTESFSWGKPDLPLLRKLCLERFGWSNQKADEILLPVLKECNKHETQLRLEAFYTFNERFAKIRSQRIKKAVKGITGSLPRELLGDFGESNSSSHKEKDSQPKQGGGKVHSRRTAKKQSLGSESQNMILEEGNAKISKMVCNNQSGTRGRRGGGRGRGRDRERGKRKGKDTQDEGLCPEFTHSDSTSGDIKEREVEAISMPRKSARQYVRPNYAEDNSEGGSDVSSNSAKEPDDNVVEKETVLDDATVAGESNTTNIHVNLDCMLPGKNSKAVDDDSGIQIRLIEAMPSAKRDSKKRLLNHVEGHVSDVCDCSTTLREGPDESKLREAETTDNTILSFEHKIPDDLDQTTSADYFLTGGGFCMDDEEDPNSDQIGEASIPTNGTEDSCKDVPSSNMEGTPKKDHIGAAEADESFGLSAMPSLRKKRRKS